MNDLEPLLLDLTPEPVAVVERAQCPFCFRWDGEHNSRCDAATASPKVATKEDVSYYASRQNRYRSPGRRGDRTMDNIHQEARAFAEDAAFMKSEQMYPMAGNVPDAVRNDRLFRAIYHMWKRNGAKKGDPRVIRMRERWIALTTGVELVKGPVS